jgi:tetratricopeptide (TPR) repeat protein
MTANNLIDLLELSQIWGRRYEQTLGDIQHVQEDISVQVVTALTLRLIRARSRVAGGGRPTDNPEAYRLYLRGRHYWNRRTGPLLQKATQYFQRAIEKDPGFGLAYGCLAQSYALFSYYGVLSPETTYRDAFAAAHRALDLDEEQVEAHVALAYIRMSYEWDWKGAEAHLRRALDIKSDDGTARQWFGAYLQACGRYEEGISEYKRALDSEPLSLIFGVSLAHGYYFARRYDEAMEELMSAIELDSGFVEAHLRLGWVLEQKGMLTQAIAEIQHALDMRPSEPRLIGALGHAYAVAGKRTRAEECLSQLWEHSAQCYVSPYDFAIVYAGLCDEDHALTCVERAAADRSFWVIWLKADPRFDLIRDSRRYMALTDRIYSKL